jgi:hypothetical protein
MKHSKRRTPKKTNTTTPRAGNGANSETAMENKVNARRKSRRQASQRWTLASLPETVTPRSGVQSGNYQGLSDIESADSESVEELLEEGNAFEANVVAGVEHADDDQLKEVHTHEVPEDDVREEYLDREL